MVCVWCVHVHLYVSQAIESFGQFHKMGGAFRGQGDLGDIDEGDDGGDDEIPGTRQTHLSHS